MQESHNFIGLIMQRGRECIFHPVFTGNFRELRVNKFFQVDQGTDTHLLKHISLHPVELFNRRKQIACFYALLLCEYVFDDGNLQAQYPLRIQK